VIVEPAVVIDASIALGASQPSQAVPEAANLINANGERLFAPSILWQEYLNGLFRLERRGIATSEAIDRSVEWFNGLATRYLDERAWRAQSLAIARRFRLSRIYDAIYYVCAEDLGAELWTCDRRFVAAFGDERPGWLKLCPDDLPADT
jgi:predicted nucleic acid-binding protein